MNLTITEDDISTGISGDNRECAVARALYRVTGGYVSVGLWNAMSLSQGRKTKWELREEVKEYIDHFDAGIPVYPITFLEFGEELRDNGE